MLTEMIPRPLRRLAAEWLGRLIRHLTGLAEEVRNGLIDAVGRTVRESVEGALHAAIRPRPPWRDAGSGRIDRANCEPWPDDPLADARPAFPDADDSFDDLDEVLNEDPPPARDAFDTVPHEPTPWSPWRLVVATGLSGLATWLGSSGLSPLATAVSAVAGTILLVLG